MAHGAGASDLRRLTRRDQKSLIKQWNSASVGQPEEQILGHGSSSGGGSDDACDGDELMLRDDAHCAPSERLVQWLRHEQCVSAMSSLASDWFSVLTQREDAPLPLTSGQVKHAYRTRARQQEAHEMKRRLLEHDSRVRLCAPAALFKQQQQQTSAGRDGRHHALMVARRQSNERNAAPPLPGSASPDQEQEAHQPETREQQQDARVVTFAGLRASQICADTALRNDVLAAIRKQLAAGRDVLLVASGAAEPACDARLMLQQLCTQSLAFCVRDQELMPTRDEKQDGQRLLLQSRVGALRE